MLWSLAVFGVCFAAPPALVERPAAREGELQITLRFDRGAAEDPPGRAGLTHLSEHLALTTDAAVALGQAGGAVEGRTTHDDLRLNLSAPVAAATLLAEAALAVLDPRPERWTEQGWAAEREGARLEALADTTSEAALRGLALYPPGHPYHRPAAGLADELAQIPLEAARDWLARALLPALAEVEVRGMEAPSALRARLAAGLGAPSPRPPFGAQASAWGKRWWARSPRPVVVLAWRLGAIDEGQRETFEFIVSILKKSILNECQCGPTGPSAGAVISRRLGAELVLRAEVREGWPGRLLGLGSGRVVAARMVRRVERALGHLVGRDDGVGELVRARLGPADMSRLSLGPDAGHWPEDAEELPLR